MEHTDILPDGYDALLTCPYNSQHQILASRIQTHLVKCRRSYPDVKVEICPFNSTHVYPEPELAYHIINCDSRDDFDRYRYGMDVQRSLPAEPEIQHTPAPRNEDGWDSDPEAPSYDAQRHVRNSNVMRNIQGATPSQRAAFREAEIKRLDSFKH